MEGHSLALATPRSPYQNNEPRRTRIGNPITRGMTWPITRNIAQIIFTGTEFLTRPCVMIILNNAINFATYAVKKFNSPMGETVMDVISVGTPLLYAAAIAWLGTKKVSGYLNRLTVI